jgi:hypothetical protein
MMREKAMKAAVPIPDEMNEDEGEGDIAATTTGSVSLCMCRAVVMNQASIGPGASSGGGQMK